MEVHQVINIKNNVLQQKGNVLVKRAKMLGKLLLVTKLLDIKNMCDINKFLINWKPNPIMQKIRQKWYARDQ